MTDLNLTGLSSLILELGSRLSVEGRAELAEYLLGLVDILTTPDNDLSEKIEEFISQQLPKE